MAWNESLNSSMRNGRSVDDRHTLPEISNRSQFATPDDIPEFADWKYRVSEEPAIRTICELQCSTLCKLSLWDHESWLLSFVGHLLSPFPTRFVRLRADQIIVAKLPNGEWSELGTFDEIARQIRELSRKIRLDPDEHGALLGRCASLKWRK